LGQQVPLGPAFGQSAEQYAAQEAAQQPTSQQPAQPTAQQPTSQHVAQQTAPQPTNPTVQQPTAQAAGFSPVPPQQGKGHKHGSHDGHRHVPTFVWAIVGGLVGALALFGVLKLSGALNKTVTTSSSTAGQTINITASEEDATTAQAVSAKCLPSVVSITVTTSSSTGIGSGVILDTSGNILTNYHVIEDAQSITVSIDGNSYDGTVVGSDSSSDLAVVKVDLAGATVTPIEVGDSSSLVVGDWVMSIGSPFGLDQSVSTGIVSSLYRSTMLQSSSGNTIYTNLIQTDAAINPGNSGGALVNDKGELVGINSIIESESGSSSGVGFAIPSNYAVKIAKQLINGETVTHAYIGCSLQSVTAQNAKRNSLSVNQGAYVASVTSGSPAESAGIKEGDIITSFDGTEITSADALILAVRSHETGDVVDVTLMRGSQEMTVSVTLGSDESLQSSSSSSSSSSNSLGNLLGNNNSSSGSSNGYGYGYGGSGSTGSYGTSTDTSTVSTVTGTDGNDYLVGEEGYDPETIWEA
jgi:putative serine protease PepD